VDKAYAASLQHKVASFAGETGTRKALHLTMVSPHGVKCNTYWGVIQSEITANDLFV
jgi:hypothetical protein